MIVPNGESALFLKVTNPEPTTGGTSARVHRGSPRRTSTPRWRRSNASLQEAFREAMADPSLTRRRRDGLPGDRDARPGHADRPARRASSARRSRPSRSGLSATGHGRRREHGAGRRPSPRRQFTGARSTRITSSSPARSQIEVGDADRRRPDGQLPGDGVGPAGRHPRPGRRSRSWSSASRSTRRRPSSSRTARSRSAVSPDWFGSIPSFESRVDLTIDRGRSEIETPAPSGSATP